jgi:cysteine synthase
VVGLTRAPSKRHLIESLGAEAVVADALDAATLRAAVRAVRDVAADQQAAAVQRQGTPGARLGAGLPHLP